MTACTDRSFARWLPEDYSTAGESMNTVEAEFGVDTITPAVEQIAEECLLAMDTISRAAAEKASSRFVDAGTVMSSFNSLTGVDAARNLS